MYIYFKGGDKKILSRLILSALIGIILVNALKYSVGRPRPYETFPEINKILVRADPSFPSSHVFISFLCFSFLPKKFKLFRKLSIIYLLLLIPIGTMYTGVHYPSDVLAGAVIGLLIPRIISENLVDRLTKRIFK
jgi:undecaprenyl-diphosphatase